MHLADCHLSPAATATVCATGELGPRIPRLRGLAGQTERQTGQDGTCSSRGDRTCRAVSKSAHLLPPLLLRCFAVHSYAPSALAGPLIHSCRPPSLFRSASLVQSLSQSPSFIASQAPLGSGLARRPTKLGRVPQADDYFLVSRSSADLSESSSCRQKTSEERARCKNQQSVQRK